MIIDSYDQHIEDASPQWPVSFGEFEKVAKQLMSPYTELCYGKNLFAVWLYFHFHPELRWGRAEEIWNQMKRDVKKKEISVTSRYR